MGGYGSFHDENLAVRNAPLLKLSLILGAIAGLAAVRIAALWRRGALRRRHRPGARGQPQAGHPHGAGVFRGRGRIPIAALDFACALA